MNYLDLNLIDSLILSKTKEYNLRVIEVELDVDDALLIGRYIAIKSGLPKGYNRFLILHELGHHVLHQEGNTIHHHTKIKNMIEQQADAFACNLLLKCCNTLGKAIDVYELLRDCGVPDETLQHYYI